MSTSGTFSSWLVVRGSGVLGHRRNFGIVIGEARNPQFYSVTLGRERVAGDDRGRIPHWNIRLHVRRSGRSERTFAKELRSG